MNDHDEPDEGEEKHFRICPWCGQRMDMRDLAQTMHDGHRVIATAGRELMGTIALPSDYSSGI
ncbi:hypothetical protein [Mesorhizobium onobrychidis]|uniref:Uncharacterized protein n=1 Tax=Mesorhizobium onobrychidis TaxID=2775404 RepID=A0ABY5QV75_9HYPH|nr:hypothetical protein [Mesorhizobium onobrychidis]UVC15111.1 hypothetical protein IHQ72_31780 [Mesorhizobium onobrychidis]